MSRDATVKGLWPCIVLALLTWSGCSKRPKPSNEHALKSKFEIIVRAAKNSKVGICDVKPQEVTYDIQKSSSIISPYVGTISTRTTILWKKEFGGTEVREDKYVLAYQDGEWVLQSHTRRSTQEDKTGSWENVTLVTKDPEIEWHESWPREHRSF
ncbi:MAG: hypothetical protein GXP25_23185 [Planctomycetes bacterium]|nr:hypothetical protein [Planctomycetota bacterium]